MSPTHDLEGPAGEQRVVMHAGAVEGQAAFAAQGVVAGQFDHAAPRERRQQDAGEVKPQRVHAPHRRAEEAVIARMMAIVGRAAGQNQFGDEAWAERQTPAGEQGKERVEARLGEDRGELV